MARKMVPRRLPGPSKIMLPPRRQLDFHQTRVRAGRPQRSSKIASRRASQEAQMRPRRPQERPKRRQEGPKTAPRAPQDGGRRRPTTNFFLSKTVSKPTWRPRGPKRPPEGHFGPPGTRKSTPGGSFWAPPPASIFKAPGGLFPPQVAQHLCHILLDTWPNGIREAIK